MTHITITPKAFFFDFDGVICDSEKAHMFATLKVMAEHGISFTENYYFDQLFGFDDKQLFQHLFEKNNKTLDAATMQQLMKDKNSEFMNHIESHIIYFDGVVDLIKDLHNKNIPLAVVSGALSSEVKSCLERGNLDSYFLFMVCADQVKNSKPDPECYEEAFLIMSAHVDGLKKEDCWVLEDSPTGLTAAKDAHLPAIAITNSTHARNLSAADHIVTHYSEIEIA